MTIAILLLLLPIAALFGWYFGRNNLQHFKPQSKSTLPQDYFVGLNYLINEQPDKAVDVFIKMLEVDTDTVDTHLALGNLFRRRGEVDRAIRVHQNLIAKPSLNKQQRTAALTELAQDYLRAGVLDRAEKLYLELIEIADKKTESLHNLLYIYEQEKDWLQTIAIAKRLETELNKSKKLEISHYYCELGLQNMERKNYEQAKNYLKQAFQIDNNCVRASILAAEIEKIAGNYKNAIRYYKQVKQQDPDYLSEIIDPLCQCYEQHGQESELMDYLKGALTEFHRISVVLALARYIQRWRGDRDAIEFIANEIRLYPSLRGLDYLIQLYLENSSGDTQQKLQILRGLVAKLLLEKPIYRCTSCGFASKTLYWQCPKCRNWSSVKPIHGLEGD